MFPLRSLLLISAVSVLPALACAQSGIGSTTSTPVPGVPHDYITGLNEIVNPANGALSIRIPQPVPPERGQNWPSYAFLYDSGAGFSLQPQWSVAATNPPVTYLAALQYGPSGGNGPGTVWFGSNNLSVCQQTGQYSCTTYTCTVQAGYLFTDPDGGLHGLGLQVGIPQTHNTSNDCQFFGVNNYYTGGDERYKATMDMTTLAVTLVDLHGNQPTTEDANGNYHDTTHRTASLPARATLQNQTLNGTQPSFSVTGTSQDGTNSCGMTSITPLYYQTAPSVVSSVTLANGQRYTFQYDSTLDLLNKITYPTGATVTYTWSVIPKSEGVRYFQETAAAGGNCQMRYDWFSITKRVVGYDGVTNAQEQDFSYSTVWPNATTYQWTSKATTVITKDLIRGTSFQTVYNYVPMLPPSESDKPWEDLGYVPVENTVQYFATDGSLLKTTTKSWATFDMLSAECTTLPSGLTSGRFYTYQPYPPNLGAVWDPYAQKTDLPSDVAEYDYGQVSSSCAQPGSSVLPVRETQTTYQSFATTPLFGYPALQDRPSTIKIYGAVNGAKTLVAETDYAYDGAAPYPVTPTPYGHDETYFGSGSTAPRGNPTTITRKCFVGSVNCTNSVTNYTYDTTGQVLSVQDANLNTTTYSYADNYTTDDGTPSNNTNAFVTKITRPTTNGVSHVTTFQYGFNDGKLRAVTDENNQQTKYCYWTSGCSGTAFDPFVRLTQTIYPDGGKTTIAYNDAPYNPSTPSPSVTTTRAKTSTTNVTSLVAFDGLGQTVRSVLTNDPDCASGDRVDRTYDGLGHVYTTSNPYCATSDTTYGLTTYAYDTLGRATSITAQDGSVTTTSYSGNTTTVSDPAGKSRKSVTDGLGRLTQVFEDPGTSPPPHLNYETDYQYDALDNLLCVAQKGTNSGTFTNCASTPASWLPRSFNYDSLSRLTAAANPESGTVTYGYDANGNVATKVAPAPNQTSTATVTTTYSYDALNRLTYKTYSDTTTSASFRYDFAQPSNPYIQFTSNNPIGRLVSTTTSGQCAFFSYDSLGRVVVSQQSSSSLNCFRGVGFPSPFTYTYNFLGRETTESNPAGFTITYGYDAAGRVSQITSSLSDSQHPATLASLDPTLGYFPNGAIRKITYGNGLSDTFAYNSRLQPCRLNLNSSGSALSTCADAIPAGSVQDFTYGFNLGTANNGNVASWSATGAQTFGRTYAYDSLNRLLTMSDSATAQACKGLSWTNDPWGNRTDQTVTAGTCNTFHQAVDANNRLLGAPYQYDAAGNLVADGNHTYTYDAENRVTNVDGGTTASYNYDAEGHRWRKVIGSVTTRYLYNLSEQVGAELSSAWGPAYVYLGGQLLAEYQNSTTYFVHKDHLGSTRLLTAMDKSVCDSLDYLPYGERIAGGSCTTHKFTGKERDPESGLDNFGARYNSSSMGRFMSPDQLGAGQHPGDPQSWNLYSYVQNNPLNLVDPTGQFTCDTKTVSQQECDNFQAGLDRAQDAADALGQKYGWDSKQYLDAQRAIDAYGDEDVDNGVVIAQGDTKGFGGNTRVAGTTVAKTDDNPTGQNIRVTLNSDKHYLSGDKNDLLALVASHEGSHVADGSDWVASGFRNNANPSREQTELDAYRVTANIGEGLGFHSLSFSFGDGKRFLTWVNGWPDQMTNFAVAVMLKNEYPRLQLDAFSRNTKVGR